MSEIVVAGAAGTPQSPADRIKAAAALIPGPQMTQAPADIAQAPVELGPDGKPVIKGQPADVKPQPSLLKDGIAEMRARREKAAQEAHRQAQYETENARLKAEVEQLKRAQAFEDDPIAYARARKWDRDQQLTFSKALLYDLAPDEADPNFRVKMFEQKQEREKKAAEEAKAKEAEQAAQAEARQTFNRFAQDLESGVMQFEAGSYPESEAEYGNNVEQYLRDMLSTAIKMADEAAQKGGTADLSPASIAKKLEAETAARVAEREKRRAARRVPSPATQDQQTPAAKTPEADAVQSVETESSKNLSGGGNPLPPARTEAERRQRAIAVLFGGR